MTTKEQLEREISALQAKLDVIKLPSRRWYKWDEFLTTFGSCSCILTREINAPGSITVRRVTGGQLSVLSHRARC